MQANTPSPYSRINGMPGSVDRAMQREIDISRIPTYTAESRIPMEAHPLIIPRSAPYLKRIFVDSRNRDTTIYPSANHFMISLPTPVKNVKSIILTSMSVANVGADRWVCIAFKLPGADGVIQDRFSGQFPAGSLGVMPLTNGAAYSDYAAGVYDDTVKLEMETPMTFQNFEIFLYGYGGPMVAPVLYALPDEGGVPAVGNNWQATFVLSCDYLYGGSR